MAKIIVIDEMDPIDKTQGCNGRGVMYSGLMFPGISILREVQLRVGWNIQLVFMVKMGSRASCVSIRMESDENEMSFMEKLAVIGIVGSIKGAWSGDASNREVRSGAVDVVKSIVLLQLQELYFVTR
ncbi:unnamed protein product, partial [Allacma fusca]